eukprot:TRINITY_DN1551_c0_g1_i5.p3 TRINITY_DN1551_c0_g1~~TRINITY_DN1551_c0_g1_i5.p3  ORF type:complete len:243 (-),score=29.15 TRINITY_DN1551_c0_g1_i5:711-1439(-)
MITSITKPVAFKTLQNTLLVLNPLLESLDMSVPEIGDVSICVMDAFQRAIGAGFDDMTISYICESIAVDIEENGVPTNQQIVRDTCMDLLNSYGEVENEELQQFCDLLYSGLTQLYEEMKKEQDDEEGMDGGCEMCERYTFLTKHHLYPRETHKAMKKKGMNQDQLNQYAWICRQCHSAAHHFISNKEMADYYHTIERLMENKDVAAFAKWNSKQKIRSKRKGNGNKKLENISCDFEDEYGV